MKPRAARSRQIPESTDLPALARQLAPLVLVEIARLAGKAAEPDVYSTRRRCGPVGVPEREWKRIAKDLGRKPYPGARWLVVERAAYDRWLASQAMPSGQPANDAAEPWSIDAALARAGIRSTST